MIEDPESLRDTQTLHTGRGFLLLLEEGLSYESGHLKQVVGAGASEGGVSDDSIYGMSFVRSPSSHASYLLGTGLRRLSLR